MPPTNQTKHMFNAANVFYGASIDQTHSSTPVSPENRFLKNYFFEQGEYVLLDREGLPPKKSWCTIDKNPILTVELSHYIKPIAVSYQHTKWNGTVPIGAPKAYDLVACHDFDCQQWEPLFSNCEYRAVKEDLEQICQIPSNLPPVFRVQFRFHENHGNRNKTCAYLVRVYGEPIDPPEYLQMQYFAQLEQKKQEIKKAIEEEARATRCSKLKWNYYNQRVLFDGLMASNCKTLFSDKCCTDCPECCRDCEMTRGQITFFSCLIIFPLGATALFFYLRYLCTGKTIFEK